MSSAVRKYVQFHQHEPKKVGQFSKDLVIPEIITCVGQAKDVLYRSDKLNPSTGEDEGWIDYIHKHSSGVYCYLTEKGAPGELAHVPHWIQDARELVWLGQCLGFSFTDHDGEPHEAKGTNPLPELYCTPSGKALLVIQGKRRILAMMWGGKLTVEPRGIVH